MINSMLPIKKYILSIFPISILIIKDQGKG